MKLVKFRCPPVVALDQQEMILTRPQVRTVVVGTDGAIKLNIVSLV